MPQTKPRYEAIVNHEIPIADVIIPPLPVKGCESCEIFKLHLNDITQARTRPVVAQIGGTARITGQKKSMVIDGIILDYADDKPSVFLRFGKEKFSLKDIYVVRENLQGKDLARANGAGQRDFLVKALQGISDDDLKKTFLSELNISENAIATSTFHNLNMTWLHPSTTTIKIDEFYCKGPNSIRTRTIELSARALRRERIKPELDRFQLLIEASRTAVREHIQEDSIPPSVTFSVYTLSSPTPGVKYFDRTIIPGSFQKMVVKSRDGISAAAIARKLHFTAVEEFGFDREKCNLDAAALVFGAKTVCVIARKPLS
eukprot:Rmarinus@m.16010